MGHTKADIERRKAARVRTMVVMREEQDRIKALEMLLGADYIPEVQEFHVWDNSPPPLRSRVVTRYDIHGKLINEYQDTLERFMSQLP